MSSTYAGHPKDQIETIECKHVSYSINKETRRDDLLTVKEVIHLKDGRSIPNIRFIENLKRPFYVTKKAYATYTQKKEWEHIDKLDKFESTQVNLTRRITEVLGYGNPKLPLKQLAASPYIYGTDIHPRAIVKRSYRKRWPNAFRPNRVAVLDIETDVNGFYSKLVPEAPILVSLTMKEKVFVGIHSEWLPDTEMNRRIILSTIEDNIPEISSRGCKGNIELFFSPSPALLCKTAIDRAHSWMPDFVAIWNINFDIPRIVETLESEGYALDEVFSDPKVPAKYKHFRYIEGPAVKESGDKTTNLSPEDRWHVVECPASFYLIDAMCVYNIIRRAQGKSKRYTLDYILDANIKRNKLTFVFDDINNKTKGVEWHSIMQRNHRPEYVAYNVFDCIGVELLDEKTLDLSTQISVLSEVSEYDIFHSNPRQTSNDLDEFCREECGRIVGSVASEMCIDVDSYVLDPKDWICTLSPNNIRNKGVKLIKELPNLNSLVYVYGFDVDMVATYPHSQIINNMSKEGCRLEAGNIRGLTTLERKLVGINLIGGVVNAIPLGMQVLKAPSPFELLDEFLLQQK